MWNRIWTGNSGNTGNNVDNVKSQSATSNLPLGPPTSINHCLWPLWIREMKSTLAADNHYCHDTLLPPWSNISSVWNVWKVFWLWVNHTPRVSGCQFLSKWWAGLLQILVMDLLFCMQPTFQTTYIPSTAISLQHTLRSEDIWLPTGWKKNLQDCKIWTYSYWGKT